MQRLQEDIKRYIVVNGLRAGMQLPPEPVLMEALGTSRNSLREAIKSLQGLGIVIIRHGMGTYVAEPSLGPLISTLGFHTSLSVQGDLQGIAELLEARQILESHMVARALRHPDGIDIDELERAVNDMREAAAGDEGHYVTEPDWRFHKTLYAPLRNSLITELIRAFWEVFQRVDPDLPPMLDPPEAVVARHERILQAVRAGDADELEAAMSGHFDDVRLRIQSAMEAKAAQLTPAWKETQNG